MAADRVKTADQVDHRLGWNCCCTDASFGQVKNGSNQSVLQCDGQKECFCLLCTRQKQHLTEERLRSKNKKKKKSDK